MTRLQLLLDLDGTLTDPKEGIVDSLRHAFRCLRLPFPEQDPPDDWVGPPLRAVLAGLLGSRREHLLEEAAAHYRAHYQADGMYRNRVYEGIPQCLAALRGRAVLHVVTSKPAGTARAILTHFGLLGAFASVNGAEPDGSHGAKGDLIRAVLARERPEANAVAMIGDRRFDIEGARENGIAAYGVAWGYGGERELLDAGAQALFRHPSELASFFQVGEATP